MSVAKKVVVFGATGNTGLAVLEVALKEGFQVTAFVRDPSKLPEELKDQVAIIQGDIKNKDNVKQAITGQDGVVITLGTRHDLAPTTLMSDGTRNIVEAMQELGVKRVSACISAFLFFESEKVPPRFRDINDDHKRQGEVLKACDLQWVAVCPPHIDDKPAQGSYEVAIGKNIGHEISKFDLAELLLKSLNNDEWSIPNSERF